MTFERIHPDWLACERCLWFKQEGDEEETWNACTFEPEVGTVVLPYFCSHWTCAWCWRPWDTYLDLKSDGELQDHNLCMPATFLRRKPHW